MRKFFQCLVSLVMLAFVPMSQAAAAATLTWDGGGANDTISTANNWNPNQAPVTANADFLIFDGTVRTLPRVLANLTVGSITFSSAAAAFTIGGDSILTISSGGIINHDSDTQSFDTGLTVKLGNHQSWNASAGSLAFLGDIDTNGKDLTLDGSFNFTMSGIVSDNGTLTKNGSGTLTLSGSAANTFNGAATVNAGTLQLNKTAGLNAFADTLTIGDGTGGANADVVRLLAANQIPDNKTVTVNSSGLLDLNGFSEAIGTLNLEGGNVTLGNAGSTFTINTALNINGGSLSAGNGGVTMSTATISFTGGSLDTGTGTLTLGGTLTGIASASTATIAGNLSLGSANRTLTIADGGAATDMLISAIVSGTVDLTKSGAGLLALSGANTYSGDTSVTAGTLTVQHNTALGTTAGSLDVDSGATLQIDGSGLSIAETINTLTGTGMGGLGALRNLANNNTWSGPITLAGTSAARINSDSGTLTLSGNITGNGKDLTIGGAGNVTISGNITTTTGTLTKDGNGTLTLSGANTFTGAATISAGTLALGASDRLADTVAMTISGGAAFNLAGFNETLGALAGAGDVALGSGTLTAGNGTTTTLSGIMSGSGSFIKGGSGTLTLSGANTYSGTTTINVGKLSISADNNVGAAPGSAMANAITLNGGTLQSTATLTLNANRGITLGASNGTVDSTSGTLTIAGVIAGSGTFTKTGTGSLALAGANTYSAATTISAGVVSAQNNTALGTAAGTTSVASGAALQVDGSGLLIAEPIGSLIGTGLSSGGALRNLANNNTWSGAITLGANAVRINSEGGTLTLSGGISGSGRDFTVGGSGNTLISGVIGTGTGAVTKDGSGILTLSNANTFTGDVTVSAGTVSVQNNTGLGTTGGDTIVASGGAVQVDGNGLIIAEKLNTMIGTGISDGGALRNLSGDNTWSGTITLGTGGARINSDAGTLTISGAISGAAKPLTVGGAGNVTISSVIGTTSGSLTKDGNGTLTLSGDNTYSGGTTISAGTLTLGASDRLDDAGNVSVASGATFNLAGFSERIAALSGGGNVTLGSGSLIADSASSTTFSGVISGAGSFTKDGNGTLTLSGGNTYTGGTTISDGTLALGASDRLADSSAVAVSSGATFNLAGFNETIGSLAGAGNVTLGSANLIAGGANTSTTHSGVISGTGGLTKRGTGTLILSGINTYTGATTIDAGVLRILGSLANSAVAINNGGTLSGNGAIGSMALSSGGTIAPGTSSGTSSSGAQTWAGGGNYLWEINNANGTKGADPGWDFLNISGTLTVNATSGSKFNIGLTSLTLANESGQASSFDNTQNYAWTIATASGGIVGFDALKFNLDVSTFQNALGGGSFGIGQSGNDLNLTFTAVPEPHEYALVVGLGLLGFAIWRRRHQQRSVCTLSN